MATATTTNSQPQAVDKEKSGKKHKEIYTYEAPWTIFALGSSQLPGPENTFRMAIGSFVEEYVNKIQVWIM
jgi:WD repeat-containing protein 68